MYLNFIPLIFGVIVLTKAVEGTKYLFVYQIAVLTILGCFGDVVYDASFACMEYVPVKNNDYDYVWLVFYVIFYWMSNFQNYVFFVFLHLW